MFTEPYKRYVLGILTLVYTLNYVDRGLIILLLEPIKNDLMLSDTQLGFLTGIAFGLFYATLGLPIARWADRGNRVTITSIAIGSWGVTVMLCVFVQNFTGLVLARIAAAIGESGCMPPTYSLLGDYFHSARERARAMTTYSLAGPLASLLSYTAGGWLNEHLGWRMTFFAMGLPGLLLAVAVRATVVEPRVNYGSEGTSVGRSQMRSVLQTLWRQPSTRHLSLALILLFTMGMGLGPWYAAFMMRNHGVGTVELGVWFGAIFGLGGIAGIWSGGYVASRWFAEDERAQLRLSALVVLSLVPCFVLFLLAPGKTLALLALVPLVMAFGAFLGPTYALMQRLVVSDSRATTLAVVMLIANLIGMGIGPQVVGVLSDALKPAFGSESLRYAMLGMSFIAIWAASHYWRAGQTVRLDLLAAASEDILVNKSAQVTHASYVVPHD